MKFGIVVFPGSNCDQDCFHVLGNVLSQPVTYIWHQNTDLGDTDCIVLPGGFSYGDYLRCGAIARFSPVVKSVVDFAAKGGLVIGICNGFQILLESGLLPGAMLRNRNIHFICKYVNLRVENNSTAFTSCFKAGQVLSIPIAHNEGNYYVDHRQLQELKENNQILLRYSDPQGRINQDSNPNGSKENIAGIVNKQGNVFGLMPHPERCSEEILGTQDGRGIFQSLIESGERQRL
jgi:phosphoribosylformylglycinamidine synthase subunit PurQ / glutaminase